MPRNRSTHDVHTAEVYAEALEIARELQMCFGPTMKRKRQAIGFTLSEFSLFCHIAPGRLSEYEHLRRFPTPKNRDRIINAFRRLGLSNEGLRELRYAYKDDKFRTTAQTHARIKNDSRSDQLNRPKESTKS